MWRSENENRPIILTKNDYSEKEFQLICSIFELDPVKTNKIVIREGFSLEVEEKAG